MGVQENGRTKWGWGCCNDPHIADLWGGVGMQTLPQVCGHGVSRRRRWVWVLLLLLGLAGSLYGTVSVLSDFLEFESSTLISLEFGGDEGLVFPAVTLWNLNPLRQSFLEGKLRKKLCMTMPELNDELVYSPQGLPSDFNDTFLMEAAHPMEDMLLTCTYKGQPCYASDFEAVPTPYPFAQWGVGYTFNPQSKKFTNTAGPEGGLHLVLDIHSEEYCPRTWGRGLMVQFHDHRGLTESQASTHIDPELGSAVGPGKRYSFALKHINYHLLGKPYSVPCIDLKNGDEYPNPREAWACVREKCVGIDASKLTKYNIRAQKSPCVQKCFEPRRYRFCDGVSYTYDLGQEPLTGFDSNNNLLTPKDIAWLEKSTVAKRFINETEPVATKSTAARLESIDTISKGIQNNIIAVDVFYKEMLQEVHREVPEQSMWSVIGEAGGLLGLFLGVSIATVFEMGEVMCICFNRRFGGRQSEASENRTEDTPSSYEEYSQRPVGANI